MIRFYANYHSQRYVGGRLVLRIADRAQRGATGDDSTRSSPTSWSKGTIEVVEPTDREMEDDDVVDRARIAFRLRSPQLTAGSAN